MRSLFVVTLFFAFSNAFAQRSLHISGQVRSEQGELLENVNISIRGASVKTLSKEDGSYALTSPKKVVTLVFSLTGFISESIVIDGMGHSEVKKDVSLKKDVRQLNQVEVNSRKRSAGNITTIDAGLIQNNPAASGNFESLLKTLPGVSANNELSAQYSVRGGNFDENLVYINDLEIFRPMLVRNGQQEGLSFINPELVSQANFSAGGFEAKYGEKLSSVLDVKYSRPDSQQLILSGGLLGLSATAKLPSNKGFTLLGLRTKTNQSILKTQPVAGSYQPKFYDIQLYHSSRLSKKWEVSFFGDYNLNRFTLIPQSRETVFGTVNEQYRLSVDYEGSEKDRYEAFAGALSLAYKPNAQFGLKWINSAFIIREEETFDIEGQYVFDAVETDESTSDFGQIRAGRGFGIDFDHGRNFLKSKVYASELKGYLQKGSSYWEAGARFQLDRIKDELNEYAYTDSAGYILPYVPGPIELRDVAFAGNEVFTRRISGFVQNTFSLTEKVTLTTGLRANYNSFTDEFLLSPRINTVYQPENQNLRFRLSAGSYNQPPFYREMRDFQGNIYHGSKAQRSWHFLAGSDYRFKKWGNALKFTSEIYYKKLDNLVPYKIENLRIRYFAGQQAKGYATGADLSISGEFVEGLESSFRLSLMKTAEDIQGDFYSRKEADGSIRRIEPGYLKRPTDQRINFSAFFQDKLFNSPTYKVHLSVLYGSALPAGPPQTERYADEFKIPAYRRVDIGFSKNFMEGSTGRYLGFVNRYLNSLMLYAEVFNLLNINNTVSYLWIKDVNNNQFAIPNFLTSRQLNFKIIAKIKNK